MLRPALKNTDNLILVIILIIASSLRFWNFDSFSFSNDELSALFRTRFDTFSELVRDGFYVDGHPGGIQVFLYYWVRLAGNSETIVRLPFVIAGVLAVFFTWLVASRWFNKVTGFFSATTIAVLQFPLLYSQIARPYVTGLLFVLIMVYFWTRLLFDSPGQSARWKIWNAAALALSMSLCLYDHYFSFLFVVIAGITGLSFLSKDNYKFYISGTAISLLLFIPHIPITLNHLSIGGVGLWLGKPGLGWLAEHLCFTFNGSFILIGLLLILIILSIVRDAKRITLNRFQTICLIWFFLPFLVGFTYSHLVNPVLQDSVLLFSFPFLVMFLFSFFREPFDRLKGSLLLLWAVAGIFSTVIEKDYYHKQHFGEFRGIAEKIALWDKQYGGDSITKAISVNNPWYIEYYLKQYNSSAKFVQYDNRGGKDLLELKHIVAKSSMPYFLYAWTKPAPLEIGDIILLKYPYLIKEIDYGGLSAISLYGRHPSPDTMARVKPAFRVTYGFEHPGDWGEDTARIVTSPVHDGKFSFAFDSAVLYGPTFSSSCADILSGDVKLIKVSVWVYNTVEVKNVHLVVSVDDQGGKNYIWAAGNFNDFLDTGEWGKVIFNYRPSEIKSLYDRLKIYIWNNQQMEFFIDDITIELYE
ncbi:MAG: glycosyltransferase family 39 protein [Bacteroidetes bacterium]|nr:glycosyltransferase family 39 protein [Bacteroidota bacterium]